jgi:hypothetical protein
MPAMSQLLPLRDHLLICARQDFASALERDDEFPSYNHNQYVCVCVCMFVCALVTRVYAM